MKKEVVLMFDGGIREGITAIGYLAVDPQNENKILFSGAFASGKGTSNEAEYRALIAGLQACVKKKVRKVHAIGDSQLIIKQVLGAFKVNKPTLKKCLNCVYQLLAQFDEHSIKWVPREENGRADKLVNSVFKRRSNKKWENKKLEKQRRKQLRQRSS